MQKLPIPETNERSKEQESGYHDVPLAPGSTNMDLRPQAVAALRAADARQAKTNLRGPTWFKH